MTLSSHVEFDAEFLGFPGDNRDLAAEAITHQYDGVVIAGSTFQPTGIRNITVRVLRIHAQPLREALRKAGLTINGDGYEPRSV